MKKRGELLKEKKKEKEYSLRDLEKKAGVTNSHIRNVEEGIRKPKFEVLMKLLNALNVEASEFMMETGYKSTYPTNSFDTSKRRHSLISQRTQRWI